MAPRRLRSHHSVTLAVLLAGFALLTSATLAQAASLGATASQRASASASLVVTSVKKPAPKRASKGPTYVQVIANQHMRVNCLTPPRHYLVTLRNTSRWTATWHLNVPYQPVPNGPAFWAAIPAPGDQGNVTTGKIRAHGTATLDLWLQQDRPCAGQTYSATINVTLPGGRTQPNIPLPIPGPAPISTLM